jgi:hypothetical protein
MVALHEQDTAERLTRWLRWLVAAELALVPVLFGGHLATRDPAIVVAATLAVALFVTVGVHPPVAAYALIASTPLIVGIDRGTLLPVLRPSEAVLLVVASALLARVALRHLAGHRMRFHPTRLDLALLLLCITSSVLPLIWMYARDRAVTQDDIFHSLQLWKYYAIFLVIRASVRTEAEVRRCLAIALAVAVPVAVIAILQSLLLFGVTDLLARYYTQFDEPAALEINRATATIGSSFAVANVMVFSLAIATGFLIRSARYRYLLIALSFLFILGTFASGQFSAAIALTVGIVAIVFITGYVRREMLLFVPAVVVAAVLLRPVVDRRLGAFDSEEGVPSSWLSRLDNLRTFFWPRVFSDPLDFLLGVRASARIPSPEWRQLEGVPGDFIWIESGHTWLLWTGGIPLLLAFLFFVWVAVRQMAHTARERTDAFGIAAIASFTAISIVAVLMTIDAGLTLRGSADLMFSLLALASAAPALAHGHIAEIRRQPP